MTLSGHCDERFESVRTAASEFATQDDDGFAFAVELDGVLVVDLWAGRVDESSLIHTFSTIKPIAACALLIAVDQGKIELGTKLGSVWPELNASVGSSTVADRASRLPSGPEKGEQRMLRGGAWDYDPWPCRSAFRSGAVPDYRDVYLSIRLAIVPIAND